MGDGKLTIEVARAEDALSPPVHYDLWYISGRESESLYGDDSKLLASAEVIRDIPMVYELPWENRHEISLMVQARDSANPVNATKANEYDAPEFTTAPSNLTRITLDMDIPGINDYTIDQVHQTKSSSVFDRLTHTLYVFYTYDLWNEYNSFPQDLHVLEIDMDTGQWDLALLGSWEYEQDGQLDLSLNSAYMSPNGTPWLTFSVSKGYGQSKYYLMRRVGPRQYEEWNPPDVQGGWAGDFSFDNWPAYYVVETSDLNPNGQFKLSYRWWDEDAQAWHQEFVCDPSGYSATSFLRPDSVVQLITQDTLAMFAPSAPLYGHIHERQPDGTWTEVLRTDGKLSVSGYTTPYWDAEWAWTGYATWGVPPEITDRDLLVYGKDIGYIWIENYCTTENGHESMGNWPATSGKYHNAPAYINDGEYLIAKSWGFCEVSFQNGNIITPKELIPSPLFDAIDYDLSTGWYATLKYCLDPAKDTMQVYLWTANQGQSCFDLEN